MEICVRTANFGLGGVVPALVFPVSVSSTYKDNVSISALVRWLGFRLADIILQRVYSMSHVVFGGILVIL